MRKMILAKLNSSQIEKAKVTHGQRKQMTHVLICEGYGQIFGSEKHCSKYYSAWKKIFIELFSSIEKVDSLESIPEFTSTFDLVN